LKNRKIKNVSEFTQFKNAYCGAFLNFEKTLPLWGALL
jgi:hypothetical protein